MIRLFFIYIFLFSTFLPNVYAAKKAEKASKTVNSGPVQITSNQMTSYDNGHLIIFKGNVVTKRDTTTIYSDILEVYNSEKKDKIDKIIAKKNVRVEQNGKNAQGDIATFTQNENVIELQGNVKAWEKENIITGDRAKFYLNKDVVKVSGNVNVTFYPKEEKNKSEAASGQTSKGSN